jgi:hypothetical protein
VRASAGSGERRGGKMLDVMNLQLYSSASPPFLFFSALNYERGYKRLKEDKERYSTLSKLSQQLNDSTSLPTTVLAHTMDQHLGMMHLIALWKGDAR